MSIKGILAGLAVPLGQDPKVVEERNKFAFGVAEQDRKDRENETKFYMQQLQLPNIDYPMLQKKMEDFAAPLIQEAAKLIEDPNFNTNTQAQVRFMSIKQRLMSNPITAEATQLNGQFQLLKENKEKLNSYEIQNQLKKLNEYSNSGFWTDKDGLKQTTIPPFLAQSREEQKGELGKLFTESHTVPDIYVSPVSKYLMESGYKLDEDAYKQKILDYFKADPEKVTAIIKDLGLADQYKGPDGPIRYLMDVGKANGKAPLYHEMENTEEAMKVKLQIAKIEASRLPAGYMNPNTLENSATARIAKNQESKQKLTDIYNNQGIIYPGNLSQLGTGSRKLYASFTPGAGSKPEDQFDMTKDVALNKIRISGPQRPEWSVSTNDSIPQGRVVLTLPKELLMARLESMDTKEFSKDKTFESHWTHNVGGVQKFKGDNANMLYILDWMKSKGYITKGIDINGKESDNYYGVETIIPKPLYDETIGKNDITENDYMAWNTAYGNMINKDMGLQETQSMEEIVKKQETLGNPLTPEQQTWRKQHPLTSTSNATSGTKSGGVAVTIPGRNNK